MDGNLVLYKIGGGALWSSKTNGKGGVKLMLRNNGNLDLVNAAGKLVWSTKTSGKFPALSKFFQYHKYQFAVKAELIQQQVGVGVKSSIH